MAFENGADTLVFRASSLLRTGILAVDPSTSGDNQSEEKDKERDALLEQIERANLERAEQAGWGCLNPLIDGRAGRAVQARATLAFTPG